MLLALVLLPVDCFVKYFFAAVMSLTARCAVLPMLAPPTLLYLLPDVVVIAAG